MFPSALWNIHAVVPPIACAHRTAGRSSLGPYPANRRIGTTAVPKPSPRVPSSSSPHAHSTNTPSAAQVRGSHPMDAAQATSTSTTAHHPTTRILPIPRGCIAKNALSPRLWGSRRWRVRASIGLSTHHHYGASEVVGPRRLRCGRLWRGIGTQRSRPAGRRDEQSDGRGQDCLHAHPPGEANLQSPCHSMDPARRPRHEPSCGPPVPSGRLPRKGVDGSPSAGTPGP
jgi:hypothetical protein